jgi:hypothetical protein
MSEHHGGEWVADTRQVTGLPYQHYGYVRCGKERMHCHPGGLHRRRGAVSGAVYARRCAERTARKLNRTRADARKRG